MSAHHGPYRADDPRTWLPDWTERPDCVAALQAASAALEAGRPFRRESVLRWASRPQSAELAAARQAWALEAATGRTRCPLCGMHHATDRHCARCGPLAHEGDTLGDVLARLQDGDRGAREEGLFDGLLYEARIASVARPSARPHPGPGRGRSSSPKSNRSPSRGRRPSSC